jgi:hypothetical protein
MGGAPIGLPLFVPTARARSSPAFTRSAARTGSCLAMRQNRQHGVAERPNTPQKFVLEALPSNSIRLLPFKMLEGLDDALMAESVQGPKQQEVKPPLCSFPESPLELRAIGGLAARLVDVLTNEVPTLGGLVVDELTQRVE